MGQALQGAPGRQAPFLMVTLILTASFAGHAYAQDSDPREDTLQAPEPTKERAPRDVLGQPGPAAPVRDARSDAGQPKVPVETIRLVNAGRFPEADLAGIIADYEGRRLSAIAVERLRQDLTQALISAGYVTSGALVRADAYQNGVLRVELVPGRLAGIELETDGRFFREGLILDPLRRGIEEPLGIAQLNAVFQQMLRNPLIERVNARLVPADERGAALLELDADLAPTVTTSLGIDNERPPSAGEIAGRFGVTLTNVAGLGERLSLSASASGGAQDGGYSLAVPLNSYGTSLIAEGQVGETSFVEEPLDELDIESEFSAFSGGVSQSWRLTDAWALSADLVLERRRGATFLLGEPFAFAEGTTGDDLGVSRTYSLRASQGATFQNDHLGAALRVRQSFGLDAFDATINPTGPDGRFFALLGQARLLARPFDEGLWQRLSLAARIDGQYATSRLLPVEQFALGGLRSVRGFRENSLVQDQGVALGVEARFRVARLRLGWFDGSEESGDLELAVFVDGGFGVDRDRPQSGDELVSVGPGVRWQPTQWARAEVYYGIALTDEPASRDALQDEGVHFLVRFSPPLGTWAQRFWD